MKKTKLVNINLAIDRLARRINKMIYYNDKCFLLLQGSQFKTMNNVLGALHKNYWEQKQGGVEDPSKMKGITKENIKDDVKSGRDSITYTLALLAPTFVDCRSTYMKGSVKKPQYWSLNANGVKLIEEIQRRQNGAV